MFTMKNKLFLVFNFLLTLHICTGLQSLKSSMNQFLPEDGKLNFTELAKKYGKSAEEFEVITEDGYILTLFHIIPERLLNSPPLFLKHGVADSADNFIVRGNGSLAMTLAAAGYDVWAGNARGNRYARRHVQLDPDKDKSFWNYSFHENGYYDVPALIDFVLAKSGWTKLNVIAHSQGTTEMFVLGATRPEYNEKINLMIALAPVVFLRHLKPPISDLVKSATIINGLLMAVNQEEIFGDNTIDKVLLDFLCLRAPMAYELCVQGIFFSIGGADPAQFGKNFLPILIGHYPQAVSRKGLLHLSQVASNEKKFAHFDYGADVNLKKYNHTSPPVYDLSCVTMNVALFVGRNDPIATIKDASLLKKRLPNVVMYHAMAPPKWSHLDWLWGLQMGKYLFPHIFNLLEKYSQQ